ncbi:MAG: tRNA (adenosine(37)-N6)-threonylcarbamoyltransferase complex dimerization subunit type 1 TsaB [Nitrospirota bacterium]
MIILGIETSTKTGSVALVSEKGAIAHYSLNIEITHSERLMSTVDRVLHDTGVNLSGVDGFAVAVGPGSFTGLRIGVSTIKGLAFATGKPVAGVSTLKALAYSLPFAEFPVCSLLDARKNQVYAALYQFDGQEPKPLMQETVITLSELEKKISGKTIFLGEAVDVYRSDITDLWGEKALFAPAFCNLPSAAIVAEIGLALIKKGTTADPDSLVPVYIRRAEAEVAWEKRQHSK